MSINKIITNKRYNYYIRKYDNKKITNSKQMRGIVKNLIIY